MRLRICLEPPPTRLARDVQHPVGLPSCVPPWLVTDPERGRNVDRLSIGYPSPPRLRAGRILPCLFATHAGIRTSASSSSPSGLPSTYRGTLPYRPVARGRLDPQLR